MRSGFILTLLFSCIAGLASAQDHYFIKWENTQAQLYMGYDNPMAVYLVHSDNNLYFLHVMATGAVISYDDAGHIHVLPTQKNGVISFYAEKDGKFYNVKGTIAFDAVPAPPLTDGTFISVMGITKDNPKNSIANPKEFKLPDGVMVLDAGLSIGGLPLTDLIAGQSNRVRVTVLKRESPSMVPVEGEIMISSQDGRIDEIDEGIFIIVPSEKAHRMTLQVSLNGRKISKEELVVRSAP